MQGGLRVRVGGALVALVVAVAIVGPWAAPRDPIRQDVRRGLAADGAPVGPGRAFVLGTDALARDELSRLLFGARVSLTVGVIATAIALLFGGAAGILAGYFRGWPDTLLMRLADVVLAFPFLLLCIAVVGVVETRSLVTVCAILGALGWTTIARAVRGKVLSLREQPYIEAARALGLGDGAILWRHVLPNVLGTILVLGSLGLAGTVLAESVLSFLGVGVPPPTPSLGSMISEGQPYYRIAPRLIFLPGGLILVIVLAFNLLGEGLRDALDPRERS